MGAEQAEVGCAERGPCGCGREALNRKGVGACGEGIGVIGAAHVDGDRLVVSGHHWTALFQCLINRLGERDQRLLTLSCSISTVGVSFSVPSSSSSSSFLCRLWSG